MIISVTVGLDKYISVSHHLMDIHICVSPFFIHAGSDEVISSIGSFKWSGIEREGWIWH